MGNATGMRAGAEWATDEGLSVKDVCAEIEILQPWVDTLLAAERDGESSRTFSRLLVL